VLYSLLPTEYHQWIPVVISHTCKLVAISIAWWIQRIVSAFHSAVRGGILCARSLLAYANKQKYIELDADDTYLDEAAGYTAAALGFYCQLAYGFGLPFPLNILFFPFTMLEWTIVWVISE